MLAVGDPTGREADWLRLRDVDAAFPCAFFCAFFLTFFCAALRAFSFVFFVIMEDGGSMVDAVTGDQYARMEEGQMHRVRPTDCWYCWRRRWRSYVVGAGGHFFARQSLQAV